MPSLQSRMIYLLMRYRHLMQGKLKRPAWDFNTSITDFRQQCEDGAARASKLPEGVVVEALTLAGIPAEWLIPNGAKKDKVILYTVGGGYVSGTCSDHRALVAKVAAGSGISVLMFSHSLAPEAPFPAALNETVEIYNWLIEQGTAPENIVIMGESAGGGLCLAALLAIRDQGYPLPAAVVALSPWTDLTLSGESYKTKVKVCLSPEGMATVCSKYYCGDNDRRNPWISPLFGDLAGLPPMLINVGEYETMLDDSTRFADKAKAAGVDVTLRVGKAMFHCYPLLAPMFPEATEALDQVFEFIKKQIG